MQTRTIAFANQKGGVGKTTSAVNLAAALAERGKRALLVDLDPQANATSALGVEQTQGSSLYTLLLGEDTTAAEKIIETAFPRLHLIPSEIDLAGAEVEMARRERYLHSLQTVLQPLQNSGNYHFIILDCPPSLGILTMNALTAAQGLIIPSQCEYLALEGLSVITRLISQLRESRANPELCLDGILMTMHDARTRLGAQVIAEVRRHFAEKVFETVIPRNVRLSEAPSFGAPIIKYDNSSAGAKAYRALARELLRRLKPAQTRPTPKPAPQVIRQTTMTRRERMRRCFCHEELDRPAVFSRTGFPTNDPTYDNLKTLLAEATELKKNWNGCLHAMPPMQELTEPHSEDFERHITLIQTPLGSLRSSKLLSLKGRPGMPETYFINNRDEAERYLSIPEPDVGGAVDRFFELDREIGDSGIVDVSLGFNPAGTIAELCGSDNFAMLSLTDRDIIHALCNKQMNLTLRVLSFLLERKTGPYFSMLGEELIVPPLHGLKDFRDFNTRYDKPIADMIHEAGGRLHIHCHGRLKAVLPGFLEISPDVIHPVEAPPMGDVTAAEARAAFGNAICIEGNIQIAAMYENSPEQVREETETLIADAFDERRNLIVSPTASPYIRGQGEACLAQYQAMIDAVLNWKP